MKGFSHGVELFIAKHTPVFVDPKETKKRIKENMCRPQYDVRNYYRTTGIVQQIARSSWFENMTMAVIAFNAIWIAVDLDYNKEEVLSDAHPVFIVAENFFCAYFSWEWLVRLLAFSRKRNCLRDVWFVFDTILLSGMVLETWVVVLIFLASGAESGGSGMGNASMLRMLRLMRLTRMARMVRLMRAMPELVILVKALVAAIRSVLFTLVLLFLLTYVFAILFRNITDGTDIGDHFFNSIPRSFHRLILDGILIDGTGDVLADANIAITLLFYMFILFGGVTVMNMLIGVLCEVVSEVATQEHDQLDLCFVRDALVRLVERYRKNGEAEVSITKEEFVELLHNPDAAGALEEVQVDIYELVDVIDTLFAADDGTARILTFPDLVEIMMDHRDTKALTIKDVTDLRKYCRSRLDIIEDQRLCANSSLHVHLGVFGRMLEQYGGGDVGCGLGGKAASNVMAFPPPTVDHGKKPDSPTNKKPARKRKKAVSNVEDEGGANKPLSSPLSGDAALPKKKPATARKSSDPPSLENGRPLPVGQQGEPPCSATRRPTTLSNISISCNTSGDLETPEKDTCLGRQRTAPNKKSPGKKRRPGKSGSNLGPDNGPEAAEDEEKVALRSSSIECRP